MTGPLSQTDADERRSRLRVLIDTLNCRKWYFSALLLSVIAVTVDAGSKNAAQRARNSAAHLAGWESPRDVVLATAHRADFLQGVGLWLALTGIGCWITSRFWREPGRQGVLIVLFVAYFLHFLLQV